jgi:predicted N-formylglutamate amidohydrolase
VGSVGSRGSADAAGAVGSLGTLVLTCEHARNAVPRPLARLFAGKRAVLATHRGYDIGASAVARALARRLGAPLVEGEITRLVLDLNRSIGHAAWLSEFSRALAPEAIERLCDRYYRPYRAEVEALLAARLARRRAVAHVSVHSFTPKLHGEVRRAEIGLLYDPRRPRERRLADRLAAALRDVAPTWRVRRNYPYRGVGDGFTSTLRRRFDGAAYAGLELEINQALIGDAGGQRRVALVFGEVLGRLGLRGTARR